MIMKTIVRIVLSMVLVAVTLSVAAQSEKKFKEIKIESSVVCNMCKERIETGIAYESGVKDVSVDLEKKEVTVKYNPSKITPDEIRKAISKLGHDADDVEADPKAYSKLPACCKKDAAPH